MPRPRAERVRTPFGEELEYSAEELEFLRAVDAYRAKNGRTFTTLRELLAVLRALGYRKTGPRRPLPVYVAHHLLPDAEADR